MCATPAAPLAGRRAAMAHARRRWVARSGAILALVTAMGISGPAAAGKAAAAEKAAAGAPAAAGSIALFVDASESPRRILHTRETIPARPGELTLAYPKWIPGEHSP